MSDPNPPWVSIATSARVVMSAGRLLITPTRSPSPFRSEVTHVTLSPYTWSTRCLSTLPSVPPTSTNTTLRITIVAPSTRHGDHVEAVALCPRGERAVGGQRQVRLERDARTALDHGAGQCLPGSGFSGRRIVLACPRVLASVGTRPIRLASALCAIVLTPARHWTCRTAAPRRSSRPSRLSARPARGWRRSSVRSAWRRPGARRGRVHGASGPRELTQRHLP